MISIKFLRSCDKSFSKNPFMRGNIIIFPCKTRLMICMNNTQNNELCSRWGVTTSWEYSFIFKMNCLNEKSLSQFKIYEFFDGFNNISFSLQKKKSYIYIAYLMNFTFWYSLGNLTISVLLHVYKTDSMWEWVSIDKLSVFSKNRKILNETSWLNLCFRASPL